MVFKADVGVSIDRMLRLDEAAWLLRDALVLVTAVVPDVLADVVPSDASVQQAEVHLLAATTEGGNKNRPNEIPQRLDLSSLGTPTRAVGPQLGFAARLAGPLSAYEAAEVVVEAFDYMALAIGFLDPPSGLRRFVAS